MTANPPFGFYLTDSEGPALCRRFCSRLRAGGRPPHGASRDGVALCRRFCRGFAAGLPMIVVRRPRVRRGGK